MIVPFTLRSIYFAFSNLMIYFDALYYYSSQKIQVDHIRYTELLRNKEAQQKRFWSFFRASLNIVTKPRGRHPVLN